MRKIYLLFFIITTTILFASDFTDELLDQSINEFSKKNYDKALNIIADVLELEPDNSIALMYKKTIEDVVSTNEEVIPQNDVTPVETPIVDELNTTDEASEVVIEKQKSRDFDVLTYSTYIGEDDKKRLIVNNGLKLILGLPVIELQLNSAPMDFDLTILDFNQFPINFATNIDNYSMDLSIGIRYKPFKDLVEDAGYFDLKVGATKFVSDELTVVPYIGFDTEFYPMSIISDNLIFNNIWLGGRGSIYNLNGDMVNNFNVEFKTGIRVSMINIGWFYTLSNITSVTSYGLLLSLNI